MQNNDILTIHQNAYNPIIYLNADQKICQKNLEYFMHQLFVIWQTNKPISGPKKVKGFCKKVALQIMLHSKIQLPMYPGIGIE